MAAGGSRYAAAHRSLVLASERREKPEDAGGDGGDVSQDRGTGRATGARQAPDNRGLLPESDVARLKAFGDEIRRIYTPAAEQADQADADWSFAAPLEIETAEPAIFDRAVTMER